MVHDIPDNLHIYVKYLTKANVRALEYVQLLINKILEDYDSTLTDLPDLESSCIFF